MTDIIAGLGIKIFADGADLPAMRTLADNPLIKGFTTNPSLMRKAGVTDYAAFAREAIAIAGERPISFEVFADDLPTMARQARVIASWGENVYVKIPVMNTEGKPTAPVIADLSYSGIKVNVTAVFTVAQVGQVAGVLCRGVPAIISMFAGRIADTGREPRGFVKDARKQVEPGHFTMGANAAELLWASPRQTYDIAAAEEAGADIITLSPELLAKLSLWRRDLTDYSRETVSQFRADALAAGFTVPLDGAA